ncbi:MAG: hypothetical protein QGF00_28390 [Planctomycetota bacterium]|nr:hypothetical protein [Planctomycetota bacterium]
MSKTELLSVGAAIIALTGAAGHAEEELKWQTTGLESYRRGPWLTEDPTKNIIERMEQPVPKMFEGHGPRDSVLPEALTAMAWMFGSKRSRFHGDPRLAAFIAGKLKALDSGIQSWRITDRKVSHKFSRASCTSMVWEMCHYLRKAKALFSKKVPFPEQAISEIEKSVLTSARVMSEPTAAGHEWVWRTRQPWRIARLMATMMAGYKLSGDAGFLKDVPGWFKYLEEDVHDLGGLRYSSIDPLPNVQWYTDHTLKELANLYLMADDKPTAHIRDKLRHLFQRLKDHYVYRALPADTYDYSAVPWPKRLWHNPPGCFGPGAIALVTGDGRNATIARYMAWYYTGMPSELRYVTLASFKVMDAIREVEPEPIPNRYVVKDDSIRGVRGLDDNYSFVFNRGPALFTVVGAKTAKVPDRRYLGYRGTYSTVLQGVTPEVGNRPWKFGATNGYHRRSANHVTAFEFTRGDRIVVPAIQSEKSSEPPGGISTTIASIAASYRPQAGSYWGGIPNSSDWQIHQLWLAVGKRLVGLMTVTSLKDQKAPYVAIRTHFAVVDEITEVKERLYRAGDFSVSVIDTNFPNREIGLSETYANEPKPRGKEIRLSDHPTDNQPADYTAGQTFHCLIDITAGETDGASQIERVAHDELLGFKASFGNRSFVLIYNTRRDAQRVIPVELGIPAKARVNTGETSKAHWLDRRHPSRDPEMPEQFYYVLPQNGMLLSILKHDG